MDEPLFFVIGIQALYGRVSRAASGDPLAHSLPGSSNVAGDPSRRAEKSSTRTPASGPGASYMPAAQAVMPATSGRIAEVDVARLGTHGGTNRHQHPTDDEQRKWCIARRHKSAEPGLVERVERREDDRQAVARPKPDARTPVWNRSVMYATTTPQQETTIRLMTTARTITSPKLAAERLTSHA